LSRSLGRHDWWNVRAEHTPHQWALQCALYRVDPFGERRADIRSAFHTAAIVASNQQEKLSDEEFGDLIDTLTNYLPAHGNDEDKPDMDALARMKANL